MTCPKCTGALPAAGMSRRAVLGRFGMGLGGIALANLINPSSAFASLSSGTAQDRGVLGGPASLAGQGEARHLSLHGRRAVADGDVRLQAGAQAAQRRAAARFGAPGPAADRHVRQSVVAAARGIAVRVQSARDERHLGQRPAAADREDRRRALHRPIDVHRGHQSRSRRSRSSRPDRRSPAGRAWARGFTTGSAATTRICRRLSCSSRPARSISRSTRGCGAAGSCRRSIRACSSAAARTRCSISRIPTA